MNHEEIKYATEIYYAIRTLDHCPISWTFAFVVELFYATAPVCEALKAHKTKRG
jgi:hypothetical protein